MVLRVPLQDFADAVRRHLKTRDVYAHGDHFESLVSAVDLDADTLVTATGDQSIEETLRWLETQEFHVHHGVWTLDDHQQILEMPHLGVVSYRANSKKTGLWLGVYPAPPSEVGVLKEFYEEFVEEGVVADLTFDEFVSASHATALIFSPDAIQELKKAKTSHRETPENVQ